MNMYFEPKLDLPIGATAPDIYESSSGIVPPDDFVVSRNRDGSIASIFGQLFWDLSVYHPENRPNIFNFCYWKNGDLTPIRRQLSHEVRHLLFLLIWVRPGSPLSLGTLQNYLTIMRAMALFAEEITCSIHDLLSDEMQLWTFIETRCSGWATQTLGSLLPTLAKLGDDQLGFAIVGNKQLQTIRRLGQQYRTTLKQHAPIPTRIYSQIITRLLQEIIEWELIADEVLSILQVCGNNHNMGRSTRKQAELIKKQSLEKSQHPTFLQMASDSCLRYFSARSRHPNLKNLSALICEIQTVLKLTIQTFTGMRDDEAISLPYHCLEESVVNGKTHYIVLGRTTKLNNGRGKRTRWITNQDGHRAIKLAQQIAAAIYGAFGVSPRKLSSRRIEYPLFVSVGYLAFAGGVIKSDGESFRSGHIYLERMKRLRKRIEPIIENADICELEHIDPHRAWRSEDKFQIGKAWLFTSHQLRRSLALYAQKSGFVSLPSLRRQLQHITCEMTRYYAKGSAFAKDFIAGDKEHFGLEWQNSQPESAALSYILNVLISNDIVFGGHANWVEHRLKDSEGKLLVDRAETLRRFKRGEIFYRETPLGGCTKIGACDQPIINWLHVDCLKNNCRNLVGNLLKLERVILAQEKMIGMLDQSSIEYRSEKADFDVLVAAREAVIKKG